MRFLLLLIRIYFLTNFYNSLPFVVLTKLERNWCHEELREQNLRAAKSAFIEKPMEHFKVQRSQQKNPFTPRIVSHNSYGTNQWMSSFSTPQKQNHFYKSTRLLLLFYTQQTESKESKAGNEMK